MHYKLLPTERKIRKNKFKLKHEIIKKLIVRNFVLDFQKEYFD